MHAHLSLHSSNVPVCQEDVPMCGSDVILHQPIKMAEDQHAKIVKKMPALARDLGLLMQRYVLVL